jgi:hypothetical protein
MHNFKHSAASGVEYLNVSAKQTIRTIVTKKLEVIFQAQSISRVILSIMQLQMNEYT